MGWVAGIENEKCLEENHFHMKKGDIKISVVVPVYNVEQYLKDCINSILVQSYSNLQIILIDDGSTDKSGQLCDEFAKTDERIQVYHQNNQGMSVARNNGIKMAIGDYIGFVDSDDIIHPKMYEHLLKALKNSGSDMAICHELPFEKEMCQFKDYDELQIENIEDIPQFATHFMSDWTGPANFAWNKLYKKEIFSNLTFPIGRKMEDIYLAADILARVSKVVWVKERLYGYRQRQGSVMNSKQNDVYKYWAEAIMHQLEVMHKLDIPEIAKQYDSYALRTLAVIQLQAQNAGLKEGSAIVRQSFCQLYKEVNKIDLSIKDRCVVFMARYCWPVYSIIHK